MKSQRTKTFAVGLVPALVLSAFAGQAFAQEAQSPWSVGVSEAVTRDSNITRTPDARSDVVSQTDMQLKLDKLYGRQSYTGSGRFGIARYKNNEQFNNTNYDVNGRIASEIGSNWSAALSGSASKNQSTGANNPVAARLEKNIVDARDLDFSLRYGVLGRLSLVGSVGTSRISYSSVLQQYQNRNQTSEGLRAVYSPSDLIDFSLGYSQADSEYRNLNLANQTGETITQRSIDLGTDWQITGFSTLNGVVSFSKNSYASDKDAGYNTVTSKITWGFTPRGAMSYSLTFNRTTDADDSQTNERTGGVASTPILGQVLPLEVNTAFNTVTTSLNGSARWAATSKVGFTASAARYHYSVRRNLILLSGQVTGGVVTPVNANLSGTSDYDQYSLSGDYRYSRALAFGCGIQKYKQTADIVRVAYDGYAYNCNASFTID